MRVLIADDELLARKRLRRLLEELDDLTVVAEAENGRQALTLSASEQPELVFMDIQMPVMDGLAAARELARQEPAPALIFCTAFDQHALAAFEAAAVDYLLKPVERDKLAAAVRRAGRLNQAQLQQLAQTPSDADCILVSSNQGMEKLPLRDIFYLRAEQKYVVAVHRGGELLLSDSLSQLEQDWPGQFVRVHRNTLVALRYLQGLERRDGGYVAVLSECGDRPAISRRHVQDVKNALRAGA